MNKAREVSSHEMAESAQRLTSTALSAAYASGNEANLRHELELSLRSECLTLGIPYIPYQLEYALRGGRKHTAFADVVHGGVIIEYEPPKSFSAGRAKANIQHAKEQVEDYAARMAQDEGRPIEDYVLAIWDGTHIAFGTTDGATAKWEPLVAFDVRQGARSQTLITSRLSQEKLTATGSPHVCLQRSGPSLASRGGGGRLAAHTRLALRSLASRSSRRLSSELEHREEPRAVAATAADGR